jgi:acylphosphatase
MSPHEEILHYSILITGKVQGVFFRASARHHAEMLGLAGFVRNETDGSVYMEAEGNRKNLNLLVEWCQRGPERAEVRQVIVREGMVQHFSNFTVVRNH